jgi:hypothetical protein
MIILKENDKHFFLEELFPEEFRDLVNYDMEDDAE